MSLLTHKPARKRTSAGLQLEGLERREVLSTKTPMPAPMPMPMQSAPMDAAMALVPDSMVTATAVRSGNWSDPNTWARRAAPGANANALIGAGLTVTVDASTAAVHTVRV